MCCPLCSAALVGGTLFTIGAYLGIVEALNTDRVAYFGYHVRFPLQEVEQRSAVLPNGAKGSIVFLQFL